MTEGTEGECLICQIREIGYAELKVCNLERVVEDVGIELDVAVIEQAVHGVVGDQLLGGAG